MSRKVWLANVGANSSHRYSSPVFSDGTFELLPIPESPDDPGPNSVRLGDVPLWNPSNGRATDWIPARYADRAAHFDPEFISLTYGDNCERAARAVALRAVQPGDLIAFLVRLESHDGEKFTGISGFFLAGLLEVESILPAVYERPSEAELARFGANAHVRKGLNDPKHWDGFWVFGGSQRSVRFDRAVQVDRDFCDAVLRTADGDRWDWSGNRSELQVIGSYTRTCRAILSPEQAGFGERFREFVSRVEVVNPGTVPR